MCADTGKRRGACGAIKREGKTGRGSSSRTGDLLLCDDGGAAGSGICHAEAAAGDGKDRDRDPADLRGFLPFRRLVLRPENGKAEVPVGSVSGGAVFSASSGRLLHGGPCGPVRARAEPGIARDLRGRRHARRYAGRMKKICGENSPFSF